MVGGRRSGLIVASNRLPVVVAPAANGDYTLTRGGGGLITALLPVLRNRGGIWVGWPGICGEPPGLDRLLESAGREAGYGLQAVTLNEDEERKFYQGFSNEIVWPLFHDLHSLCTFDPSYWQTYQTVNRRYAEVLARN